MNSVHAAKKDGIAKRVLAAFVAGLGMPRHGVHILENESEDLWEQLARGRKPKLHGMTGGAIGRVEENYLYFTRRFPSNTSNNTIGSGAIVAGDYPYFHVGLQDAGASAGYFSVTNLTLQQTNMASGGRVPHGRAFQLFDIGVTFNAAAAPADVAACLDSMSLSYSKQQATSLVQHGPIKLWPGGTGMYGFASTTATTTTIAGASNGMPAMTNVRRFRSPRILSANENFVYTVSALAATPNANTTIALTNFVEVMIWLFGRQADKLVS